MDGEGSPVALLTPGHENHRFLFASQPCFRRLWFNPVHTLVHSCPIFLGEKTHVARSCCHGSDTSFDSVSGSVCESFLNTGVCCHASRGTLQSARKRAGLRRGLFSIAEPQRAFPATRCDACSMRSIWTARKSTKRPPASALLFSNVCYLRNKTGFTLYILLCICFILL